MNLCKIAAIAAAIALSGCAVQKALTPTGGSRSDGVVRLSYTVSLFEKPVVDYEQGRTLARQRCAAWGYSDAEPFGGETQQCQQFNNYGNCVQALVTVEYQCTGQPDGAATPKAKPAPENYDNHLGG